VLWPDEALFKTNRGVNWHSYVYWSDEISHQEVEYDFSVSGEMVWIKIWYEGVKALTFLMIL
jgi:hypothetical protein